MTRADFQQIVEALGDERAVAVGLIDLDDFAGINNRFGHATGDQVLAAFERTFVGSLPKGAVIARIGGDEYAAALPDCPAETALIHFEEIRSHLLTADLGLPVPVGLSAGIAARPPHAETADELMRAADEALMRAKREGRARITIWVEEKMTMKSNYYSRAQLDRLSKLSAATGRTEASLLREALESLLDSYGDEL